ncbi:hypothetical protein Lser_V15G11645 [Lactuca serriola]
MKQQYLKRRKGRRLKKMIWRRRSNGEKRQITTMPTFHCDCIQKSLA